jgi:hypothetical protein
MELTGFTTIPINPTTAYVMVPDHYIAYCPESQVIRVNPGYILDGFRLGDYSPIFRKSSRAAHRCERTYIPVRTSFKMIEVNDKYNGPGVVYARENHYVVFFCNEVRMYNPGDKCIVDPKKKLRKLYFGEFPIMIAWLVVKTPTARETPIKSLLKTVLLREARKFQI